MTTKTAIIIPARFASTRLPGKPLIKVLGKPIIQWVFEKAKQSKLADEVIIATDNDLVFEVAKTFTDSVELTDTSNKSGSDRIAEVAKRHEEFKYIVNLQGDEPLIKPNSIDSIIKGLKEGADISTLVRVLTEKKDIENPNCVKCVKDNNDYALYFSRSKIPYERNENEATFYGHIGIYGYTREALFTMTQKPQSMLEKTESLEQLRALQLGLKIKTYTVDFVPVGIDTQEDLKDIEKIAQSLLK